MCVPEGEAKTSGVSSVWCLCVTDFAPGYTFQSILLSAGEVAFFFCYTFFFIFTTPLSSWYHIVPRPGTEPGPLAVRKHRVLTTGLPENSPSVTLLLNIKIRFNFYLNFKYLFLAVLCGVFSSCAVLGWPSWWCSSSACSGFSCGGWALGSWASVAVGRGP